MSEEIYVSVDVESDGPIPGPNSMLSLGAVALKEDKTVLGTFSVNLDLLPGASGNPETMAFWARKPEQWKKARENPEPPEAAMRRFVEWVEKLPGTPTCVAYPAGYDFNFLYNYLIKFVGRSPFSFSCIDIKTYAMALLKKPYRDSTKRNMPKDWFDPAPHTHVAVEDAMEQGLLFLNMIKANKATNASRWDVI
jgi:DNA polymerase III alpha subunit (gram-positive type)